MQEIINYMNFTKKTKFSLIEPEEIFMDSFNPLGFSSELMEGKIEKPLRKYPFFILGFIFILVFLLFLFRLFNLEITKGNYYFNVAEGNRLYSLPIVSSRGIMYDRSMRPLASNERSFSLVFRKNVFAGDNRDLQDLTSRLSEFLGKSEEDIAAEGLSGKEIPQLVVLEENLNPNQILKFESVKKYLSGISIEENFIRKYADPSLSHVIGYIGNITKDDLKKNQNYYYHDTLGKTGLEFIYEKELRGKPGEKIKELGNRENIREKIVSPPISGENLVLSIDKNLQEMASNAMLRSLGANGKEKGAIIIQNPRNGQILALVSHPAYNNNIFSSSIKKSDFEKIVKNKNKPLFNRAISGEYPPGSTIKPFLAVAAIEEKIIDPKKKIYDSGSISVPDPYRSGEKSVFLDWKPHGWIDMFDAIAYSANVYFYTIGGGYGDIGGLGVEKIKKYAALFGFGSALGIDLPGEKSGLLPDPSWKNSAKQYQNDPFWRIGDTYHISIGQGDMTATPLQINSAVSALANGGTLFKPYIVTAMTDQLKRKIKEISPEILRKNFLDENSINIAREGMRMAVTVGSARMLADLPFDTAGKTGTAQTGVPGQSHAWFTGFAPYENPEIAITVIVEDGGEGSAIAVPIAKEILYYYFTQVKQ